MHVHAIIGKNGGKHADQQSIFLQNWGIHWSMSQTATKTAMAQGGGLRFGPLPVFPDGDGGILDGVMCGWQTSCLVDG